MAARHYLSATEAATYLGLSRDGFYKRPDTPTPDATIGNVRGWKMATLDKWDAAYGQRARKKPPRSKAGESA